MTDSPAASAGETRAIIWLWVAFALVGSGFFGGKLWLDSQYRKASNASNIVQQAHLAGARAQQRMLASLYNSERPIVEKAMPNLKVASESDWMDGQGTLVSYDDLANGWQVKMLFTVNGLDFATTADWKGTLEVPRGWRSMEIARQVMAGFGIFPWIVCCVQVFFVERRKFFAHATIVMMLLTVGSFFFIPRGVTWPTDLGRLMGAAANGGVVWMFLIVAVTPIAVIYAYYSHSRRRRDLQCAMCGYNLLNNITGICPECGQKIPRRTRILLAANSSQPAPEIPPDDRFNSIVEELERDETETVASARIEDDPEALAHGQASNNGFGLESPTNNGDS